MRSSSAVVWAAVAVLAAAMVLEGSFALAAEARPGVSFYLLKNEGLDFETARKMPLDGLVLQDKPWIASEDIQRYDWSSHCLYLNKDVPIAWKRINLRGTPFVVVADGRRCYLGALWTLISSFLPMGNAAVIHDPGTRMGGQGDLLAIGLMSVLHEGEREIDVRDDPRVREALRRQAQYHAGLQCSLDEVRVEYGKDTCSVIYTYTVRNADEDDLYVLDPERIDPVFFHDFQNGVRGRAVDRDASFAWPNPRKGSPAPIPWGKVDVAWLSRLKKGASMTRTVTMDGLPRILPGRYECTFSLGSPGYGHGSTGSVTKAERQRKDGRVWIGRITATRTVVVAPR